MSRKKTQPKKNVVPDPKFNSTIIPKLINNIMYKITFYIDIWWNKALNIDKIDE